MNLIKLQTLNMEVVLMHGGFVINAIKSGKLQLPVEQGNKVTVAVYKHFSDKKKFEYYW